MQSKKIQSVQVVVVEQPPLGIAAESGEEKGGGRRWMKAIVRDNRQTVRARRESREPT